ncbi:PilZ domain-containing protein [Thiolapillus sp.]
MEAHCKEAIERRGFVRIDDTIVLKYRKADMNDFQNNDGRLSADMSSFTIKARFAAIDQKLRPVRHSLEQRSPELLTYLNAIDEKLNLLADLAFETEHDLIDLPTQEVSLSAGGTSFLTQKPLELGTLLELWLLLLPSHAGIITYANVIYCKKINDNNQLYPYKVGVEFKNIREEDADLIICHVLKKEADERRRRSKLKVR